MRTRFASICLLLLALLAFAGQAMAYNEEEIETLRKKMDLLKQTRRSRIPAPDNAVTADPRAKVVVVAVTDSCREKMKGCPGRDALGDVCDYVLRSGAAAVGIDSVFDIPEVTDAGFVGFVERSPRVVLATDASLDPNRAYRDWDEAGNDFIVTDPYRALDLAVRRKGFNNFDLSHGFQYLRFHSFLKRGVDIYLSMPLALVFTAEGIDDFEIVRGRAEDGGWAMRFGRWEVPKNCVLDYRYNFRYIPFKPLLDEARAYLKDPVPAKLSGHAWRGSIVIVGGMHRDSKAYVKNNQKVYGVDLLANAVVDIYSRAKAPVSEGPDPDLEARKLGYGDAMEAEAARVARRSAKGLSPEASGARPSSPVRKLYEKGRGGISGRESGANTGGEE